MKVYSNGSSIRKPMMYGGGASMKKMMGGGMANTVGNSMAAGMRKNKMGMMGMMYGSSVKKMKKK
tara:strand:+ start:8191 stop:8385 length:195 start_codon:yes stop_codon:yes gene_type:complete